MNKDSTYRLGTTDAFDTLATYYHLYITNPRKQLGFASRLQIARFADLNKDLRILEIGPSAGVTTAASLNAMKKNITLFDSWGYYRQWSILEKYNSRLKVVIGDADMPLPFRDASFDVCVFMGAICYMKSPLEALKEVRRVLDRGGVLFVSSTRRPENNINNELGRLDRTIPTYWNRDELVASLEKARFSVVHTQDYGMYPKKFFKSYRAFLKFKYFAGSIYSKLVSLHPDKFVFAGAVAVKEDREE